MEALAHQPCLLAAAAARRSSSSTTSLPHSEGVFLRRRLINARRWPAQQGCKSSATAIAGAATRDSEQALEVATVELPALHSRFPLQLGGSHQESIRQECEEWGLGLLAACNGSSATPAERQAFLNGRYYLCGPLFFPGCRSRHRLALLSKFFFWGFMMDDVMELTPPHQAAVLLRAIAAVWTGGDGGGKQAGGPPYQPECSRMAAVVQQYRAAEWQEMCRDMSPSLQARLERLMLEWFHAVGADQSSSRFQTVDEYCSFRIVQIGAAVFLPLVEYSLGIEVEEHLASIPILLEFRDAALKHFTWVNDLLSFRKEVIQHAAAGYGRGSIGILLAQHQAAMATSSASAAMATSRYSAATRITTEDLQRCIDKLWAMILEQEMHIASLVEEIKCQFPASSDLVKYVDAICGALGNNMYWYTISGRYGLLQHAIKFLHGQPAGARPTIVSLVPDHDPSLQLSLKAIALKSAKPPVIL